MKKRLVKRLATNIGEEGRKEGIDTSAWIRQSYKSEYLSRD